MNSLNDRKPMKAWLAQSPPLFLSIFTGITAFCLYTCVYAFRKSFAVATFDGIQYLHIDYKVWLVTFQVVGYAVSKFAGIKIISELKATSRASSILLMVTIASVSWLLFAIVPAPFNMIFLFTNGFPLGLVWGMIFSYLEGRQSTDFLGAALATAFIFAAGLSKSVGGFMIRDWHVSETWMPFSVALISIIPFLFFLWLIEQVPPPSAQDEKLRTKRNPMDPEERKIFIGHFFWGLLIVTFLYAMLTAFRDFRDNFSSNIWNALGYRNSPEIFTTTEIPIAIFCLIVIGSLVLIKNNRLALNVINLLVLSGMLLLGVSTFAFQQGWLSPPVWMTLVGLGLYLGYIPFNSAFFDRLLATFHISGTVNFTMYVVDAFGYLASVGVLFYKQFGQPTLSWTEFFTRGAYVLSVAGIALTISSMAYFQRKKITSTQKGLPTGDYKYQSA